MSGLFDRWRTAAEPAADYHPAMPIGLQVWLDDQARVLRLAGPLRSVLALPAPGAGRLHDYLQRRSWLVIEGAPADWQGQPLDLDFHGVLGQPLHTRGWLLRQSEGWMLQLFDIGDLLQEHASTQQQQVEQQLAADISRALRDCSEAHLQQTVSEQLQRLAEHWQAASLQLLLCDDQRWRSYARSDATWPWPDPSRLQPWLAQLPVQGLLDGPASAELQALCADPGLCLLPYRQGPQVQAWLLCAGVAMPLHGEPAQALMQALLQPLLGHLHHARSVHQARHLQQLQQQLGAGWWEWSLHGPLQLDPGLAASLELPAQVSLEQWLARLHPADREPVQLALEQAWAGRELSVSLRLPGTDAPRWLHWAGQLQGRQLRGFILDVSALKAQELQTSAARARLENLIASSPAVIYVQRCSDGALHSEFFSASLQPMLGWAADSEQARQPGLAVHPDDHALWLQRTRDLLREGQARCRVRLRDSRGGYHWILDEARLLRDDLGQPLEVVGLWLDVSEATEAAERVRLSEERYRVLVEDSPAMICRYRPDLSLMFGNRPLADYLQCTPEQLVGMDLGQWLSPAQRAAFVERLRQLTPEQPLSSSEICLQLPGREHAWWIWADRGLFDEHGQLLEIQAVGRDNTEVRRSQLQLLQGAKMATLGELATGLLHEINQPLNVIRMATVNTIKRVENGLAEADYLLEKLRRIEAQTDRVARLVDHMRVFGRRSEVEREWFPAWAAVTAAVALLDEGLRGKGVSVQVSVPDEQPQVLGHQDQLEQVLINLLVNARDALLGLGRRDAAISLHQSLEPGSVVLWVQDNGGGIDPQLHERIFEPFFTTKPAGVGTGLGLSVSHGIVSAMGGSLQVSNQGDGACFCIRLPCHSIS